MEKQTNNNEDFGMITLNGVEIKPTIFPDKTSQVWHLPKEELKMHGFAKVVWKFENEAELFHLAQLKHLLDDKIQHVTLTLPYLPYGRQDKCVSNDGTFALRTFAIMINNMYFDEIIIHDPHSEVALNHIGESKSVFTDIIPIIEKTGAGLLCYPDKGAVVKYSKVYGTRNFIYGEKIRDQSTGNILSYEVFGGCNGSNVLIVDDICDGGATFIHLAKALKIAKAKEINLFVSHGLFTKGIQVLKDAGINRIFTQDGEVK